MTESGWCSEYVYRPRVTSSTCSNRATVERNGKLYCTVHDPDRVAAKRAERQAAYNAARERAEKVIADASALADRMSLALGVPVDVRFRYDKGQTRVDGLSLSLGAALNYLDSREAPL